MTDEQKVRLLPCPWCGSLKIEIRGRCLECCACGASGPELPLGGTARDMDKLWNTRQAALSQASATVEECEAAGEESCKRCGGTGEVVEHCWEHDQIVKCPDCNHSPRAAEDATGWREMDSAPADKAIMGAWFGSPEYTEVSPVIYCSERGKWMNPDDMRDDEYTMPDMWHPYPSAPPHRAIDQAIAGKRGGE